jgi:uncharacterized membrane-anchored protein YitT (DUF2179 family)
MIMNGGVTGVSQLLFYLYQVNFGLMILLLNVPLFVFALFFYRKLFYHSIFSMIMASFIIGMLQNYLIPYGIQNMWIGSIVGGLWMGFTFGVIARLNSSLGGGSLLAKMINLRYGFSMSKSLFWIDSSVYPLCFIFIGLSETFFSLLLTANCAFGIYLVNKVNSPWLNSVDSNRQLTTSE